MTKLIELLQPHIDDPDLERNKQEMEKRKRQEKARKEQEEERKKMGEMLEEIEKNVVAIKEALRNSCIVTIVTRVKSGTRTGIMDVNLEKGGEETTVTAYPGANGLSSKVGESAERELGVAMNYEADLKKGLKEEFGEFAYPLHMESLYELLLSVDNIRVTYK